MTVGGNTSTQEGFLATTFVIAKIAFILHRSVSPIAQHLLQTVAHGRKNERKVFYEVTDVSPNIK